MKTDDFISLLAQDASPPWRLRSVLTIAAAGGILIAAILFFGAIGFRPDIAEAVGSGRFLFKFVVTIALAITAFSTVLSLGRPGGDVARKAFGLMIAPILLVCAAAVELMVVPSGQWLPNLIGHNARFCLTLIPLLSVGPLICFLAALRQGAPSNPGLAGAVAGLAASAIAATFYAANCTDDSPLFVVTWYPIAIAIVASVGCLAGRKLLSW